MERVELMIPWWAFPENPSLCSLSQIPLCDNLLQIDMPNTPLTDILRDFRCYRPGNHREFLEWVHGKASQVHMREFAMKSSKSAALYLRALDQVRDFRWRHWSFTREYILKHTKHQTATGGSPIVTVSSKMCTSYYSSHQPFPCSTESYLQQGWI